MKPRIAIDTSYMDRRPGKGTAIVIRHSVEELLRYRDRFDITLIHREHIPEDPLYKEFREIVIPRVSLPKFSNFFSELVFFLTTRERFDVYYFSYSRLYPTFWLAPARRIVFAAMDGGPQTAGYMGKAKGRQPWHVQAFFSRIAFFVALSRFGKEGICKVYGLNQDRVKVVYNGLDERFLFAPAKEEAKGVVRKYKFPEAYVLCVSRLDPHKNILRLLEAYASLGSNVPDLVIVGGRHMPDYSKQVEETIGRLGLSGRAHIAPFIEDEDMPALYAAADLFVFPSLYEGFGLPVLEALAAGTALTISNIASLVEVAGGHALPFDPYSVEAIADAIRQTLALPEADRTSRAAAGREWAAGFTWKKHGDALASVLEDAATI